MNRSFTLVYPKKQGRYISKEPKNAAKKAFMQICRETKSKKCKGIIIIKETTKESEKKVFIFFIKRITLQKPLIIKKGDKEIIIKYKIEAERIKKKIIMKGGSGMDMDMDMEDNEKQALTGFYNLMTDDIILHTDYFMYPKIKQQKKVLKDIFKKHKSELKNSGLKNISIELFDVMPYPLSEGKKSIKEALEAQLPIYRKEMNTLNQSSINERKKDAFDFSDIQNILNNL